MQLKRGALLLLYVTESCLLVLLVAANRLSDGPLDAWPGRIMGQVGIAAAVLGSIAGATVLAQWLRAGLADRRALALTAMLNVVTVVFGLTMAEIGLRLVASDAGGSTRVGRTLVMPRSWSALSDYWNSRLQEHDGDSFWSSTTLVPDPSLGWTLGPLRSDSSGLYFSDANGLRSGPDQTGPDPADEERTRLALVGDSFAYGAEVEFAASFAHQLDERLGADTDVLNFGVGGYGVDQAYLRYHEHAAAWEPELVIFAVITHDFYRTLSVYNQVTFPSWDMPFGKPRLELSGTELRPVVSPVLSPAEIFAHEDITTLPGVEWDRGYDPDEWQKRWFESSYFVRFLRSRFAPWQAEPVTGALDELRSLNGTILRQFGADVARNGSIPLIVYLPTAPEGELGGIHNDLDWHPTTVMQALSIPFVDLTETVERIPVAERYSGTHYSPLTNQAVADALAPIVRAHLERASELTPQARRSVTD